MSCSLVTGVPTCALPASVARLRACNFLASPATAHEVWAERDAAGPARIYLGEPADPVPAAGDPEFSKLTAPRLIGADGAKPAALVRRANHKIGRAHV